MTDEMKIDTAKGFPHLSRAPIVEAAFEIRARAEAPWEETAILEQLKAQLPDYPSVLAQRAFQQEFTIRPDEPPQGTYHDLGLKGFRLQSNDSLRIAQFTRDTFVFSRLRPYEGWLQFCDEAFRLWRIHTELARPSEIQRLGLRFINRITFSPERVRLEDYLVAPPQMPERLDLPLLAFFHHDTFAVPGHPYIINLVSTVQPQQGAGAEGPALIVDIDVFNEQPFTLDNGALKQRADEMRWLKNKVFFGSITSEALETFK
jgi:uncharacterized protein (TIGR04255 family)